MVRSVIRKMMALALVPEEHVSSLFAGLGEELTEDERDELSCIFTYFERQWLRETSMWNVFDIRDKTNNFSEGT
jgi:hypothetical protein